MPEITPQTEVAAETMVGDLMQFLIQELKVAPKPWQAMSEEEQQEVIDRSKARVESTVRHCIRLLAAGDRPTLAGQLASITMKDGIKAVVELPKHTAARHELFDAQGSEVLIVVMAPEVFAGGVDQVQPDPQQPGLELKAA
jgi:hypothetical protein